MATERPSGPAIPLAGWADRQIAALGQTTRSSALRELSGAGLLSERACLNGFRIGGMVSPGGGCRLHATRDGWVALNLARADDHALLPALFGDDVEDDKAIAACMAKAESMAIVARGREMGMAIAALNEPSTGIPSFALDTNGSTERPQHSPLVLDLSALWAGPLAAHLLWLAGAEVVKVESTTRPDSMRDGDAALFALLNQGKASVALDFRDEADRQRLTALLARADIVIEAARPRALLQLGIDANQIVRTNPGLVWITITGHGAEGDAANWVGFGDDCGVAGGLSAALRDASGTIGFVGDAIADPMTGILAARLAWERWTSGAGARIIVSMSGVIASALAQERMCDAKGLDDALGAWARAKGAPFPPVPPRAVGAVAAFGADTDRWIGQC